MNVKKILASATVLAVVASQVLGGVSTAVDAVVSTSVNSSWESAVKFMKDNGLSTTANSVSQYEPMATVRREAGAKLFANFALKFFSVKADNTKVCTFSDINAAQSWAVPFITEACQMGIFKGSDGKFLPQQELTKLQFLTVLARIVKRDSSIEPVSAFNIMKTDGITKESDISGTYRPVNRIELAMLFQRAVSKYVVDSSKDIIDHIINGKDDNKTNTNTNTGTTANVTGGKVTFTLNSDNPVSQNIPTNSSNIEFLKFNVTAGDKDVTLNTLTFKRFNLGSRSDFNRVWLTNDGVVVSNAKPILMDDTVTLNLHNQVVKAHTTSTYVLNASMATTDSVINQFKLVSAGTSTSDVVMAAVISNPMTTVLYPVSNVTFRNMGSDGTIIVGKDAQTIANFKLTETSPTHKNVTVKSIRFKNNGGVDLNEDLSNIALYASGTKVSTQTIVDGNYVTFKLNNLQINDGKSKYFTVKADVIGGYDKATLQLALQNTFDIYAIENGTNIGANIATTNAGLCAQYTLNAGVLVITRDSSTPPSDDYVRDTDDVLALVAKVITDQRIDADSLKVDFVNSTLKNSPLYDQVDNIRLYVNDSLIDSVDANDLRGEGRYSTNVRHSYVHLGGATTPVAPMHKDYKLDGDYVMFNAPINLKNHDLIKVYIRLKNGAQDGTKLQLELNNNGLKSGESNALGGVSYESDSQYLKAEKMSGVALGNVITVRSSASGVAVSGNGQNFTVVDGQRNVDVMPFFINGSDTTSTKIKKLVFKTTGSVKANQLHNVHLVAADGTQVGDLGIQNGNDTFTIDNINYTIAKGSEAKFRLVADFDSSENGNVQFSLNLDNATLLDVNDNEINSKSTINGPVVTVVKDANINVAIDGNNPSDALLVAGQQGVNVAAFKLSAQYSDVSVRKLTFKQTPNTIVDSYTIYANDKAISTKSADSNNEIVFTLSSNKLVVSKDSSVTLWVKANLKDVNDSNPTNQMVKVTWEGSKADSQKFVTDANGQDTTLKTVSDVEGSIFYVRASVVKLAQQDVPSLATSNDLVVSKFTATADGKEINAGTVVFHVTPSGVTVSEPHLLVNGDRDLYKDCAIDSSNPTDIVVTCDKDDMKQVVIGSTPKTFELTMKTIVDPSVANPSLSTTIKRSDSMEAVIQYTKEELTKMGKVDNKHIQNKNFVWTDSVLNTDPTWYNGYDVPGLPLNTHNDTK